VNNSYNQTWQYVEKWAEIKPDAEAMVYQDNRLKWSDVKTQMNQLAKSFLDFNVQQGDSVAFLAMARPDFLTSFMAANKVGAVWFGLNPKFTYNELKYQLDDARPKVLMTISEFMGNDLTPMLNQLKDECSYIKKIVILDKAIDGFDNIDNILNLSTEADDAYLQSRTENLSDQAPALLMYTSGSTGKPKGVVHTHESILENLKTQVQYFAMHENSRGLLHFPINHVAADIELGYALIYVGACSVMMDSFHPVESLKIIPKEKITLLGQMPVMFLLQMKQPEFAETDFSSVEQYLWAGAAAPKLMVDILKPIADKHGATLVTGYGSTEVAGFVTYTKVTDNMHRLMNTAGKIADAFELKIVDDERNEIADGEVGEIAVKGKFMFKEYLNKPDATAQVLDKEGWYYTNDLGHKDEDGYITIVGRKSEMFKTGGENVFPREVEEALETHPAVIFAAVIGVPDDLYQEVGWAYIMKSPEHALTEDELINLCNEKLANYKRPKKFFIRDALPMLPTGKVDKMTLKSEVNN